MSGSTKRRSIRVDDRTWESAQARAEREYRTLTDVLRVTLRAYADGRYDAIEPPSKGG